MKYSKTVIAYIFLVSALIRLYLRRDIIIRAFEEGVSRAPMKELFVPLLLFILAVVFFVLAYKKKPAEK